MSWAAPVPLPSTGVTATGLQTDNLRVDFDPVSRKMSFSRVSASEYADIASCEAIFSKGQNTSRPSVENWNFETHSTPTDWYIVLDESNSMRISAGGRVYLEEAVNVITHLLKNAGRKDTVSVRLVASEMTELGNTANRAKLTAELNKLGRDAAKRKGHTHQRTAIFHYGCKVVNSLPAADTAQGRKRVLLLLTDGEDDASAPGESEDLITAANKADKNVAINCVTFFKATAPRNTQVNTFERLCTKTQGNFYFQNSKCDAATASKLADTLSRTICRPACSFTIQRPAEPAEAQLQLKFRLAGDKEAELTLTPEALSTVCLQASAGTTAETDALVADILKRVSAATTAVKALTDAETKKPEDPAAVKAAIVELSKHTSGLLPICRSLKSKDAEKVRQSISSAVKKQDITTAETKALKELQKLLSNTGLTAEQLNDTHMLELLGRTAPLPYPGVNAAQHLLSNIAAAADGVKALSEAEANKTPDMLIISREAFGLRRKAEAMLDAAKQLKNTPEDEQTQALELLQSHPKTTAAEKTALEKVRAFCANKTLAADKLTTAHMLELLGRKTPLPTPEADALTSLREIIAGAAPKVKALAAAEKATPVDTEQVQKAATDLRPFIDKLKQPATTLKTLFAEAVQNTVRKEMEAEGTTEADKAVLARILSYSEDSAITADKVAEKDLLKLLGRDTPLPKEPAKEPLPTWLYIVIGLVAVLVLVGSLYTAHMKRKKKEREAEEKRIREEERRRKAEEDRKKREEEEKKRQTPLTKPAAVPAGTPGVAPQAVLAVLDVPGTNYQWWVIEPLVNIGRDKTNDVVLLAADMSVSARHCAVKRERDGSWTMYDLGSKNKIYYNDALYSQLSLTQGMIVELGTVKLRFHVTDNRF